MRESDSNLLLAALWEASYTAVDCFDVIRVVDRVAVCGGLCYMLAALSDDQQMREFEALASLPLGRLERLTTIAKNSQSFSQLFETLPHVGDEICILSSLSRSFTNARAGYEIGKKASTDKLAPIPESVLQVIHRGWPSIAYAAANWADEEVSPNEAGFPISCLHSTMVAFSPR